MCVLSGIQTHTGKKTFDDGISISASGITGTATTTAIANAVSVTASGSLIVDENIDISGGTIIKSGAAVGVFTNAANIFTEDQRIKKSQATLFVERAAVGENALVTYVDESSTQIWQCGMEATTGDYIVNRFGVGAKIRIDKTSGKMTGGTVPLARIDGFSASYVINFGSIASGTSTISTQTLTGVVLGDFLLVSTDTVLNVGLVLTAVVSAANTIRIQMANVTAGTIDPASMTFHVKAITMDF